MDVLLAPLRLVEWRGDVFAQAVAAQPAAAVTIDFLAYVDPGLEITDTPTGSTAGQALTPIVALYDHPGGAFAATHGVIAADAGLLGLYESAPFAGASGVRATLPRLLSHSRLAGDAATLGALAVDHRPATPGKVVA